MSGVRFSITEISEIREATNRRYPSLVFRTSHFLYTAQSQIHICLILTTTFPSLQPNQIIFDHENYSHHRRPRRSCYCYSHPVERLEGQRWITSTFRVIATPDQVRNGTTPTPGEPGAVGFYNFALDSKSNTICFVSSIPDSHT
jgi:hypothetical protein